MRAFLVLASSLCFVAMLIGCSQPSSAPPPPITASVPAEMSSLVGVWDVALHFDPTQPPSATVLEISAVEAGDLTGSFYGTEFEVARAVSFEGEIRLSFITSDGSGPYASAGRLLPDGTLSGQTLSTGRRFLMAWTARLFRSSHYPCSPSSGSILYGPGSVVSSFFE